MKKIFLRIFLAILTLSLLAPATIFAGWYEEQDIVCLGGNLDAEQTLEVARLLDVDLNDVDVIYVSIDEERDMLGDYVSAEKIGTRSISSARVQLREEGTGIVVHTHNITWVTSKMYASALATAGVTDAKITVAAPFRVSGTAALTGILKAYEGAADTALGENAKQTASEELVITGTLGEAIGQDEASDFIAWVKKEALEQGLDDPEQLHSLIDEAQESLNIDLDDDQKESVASLINNIVDLDIDADQIYGQLDSLYQGMQKLGQAEEVATGALGAIGDFFKGIFDWFAGLGQ